MYNKNYPDTLYGRIKKMSLPELESFIERLSKEMGANHKIDVCLSHRKYLLRNMFKCTPDNVERLFRVANLIKERVEMLHHEGNRLYAQMCKVWQGGENKPFTDFYVELSLRISFNDAETSILHIDDDESGSNYLRMAELLDDFYSDTYNRGNLMFYERIDSDDASEKIFKFLDCDDKVDNWGEPWFFDEFPELRGMPVVYEMHDLLFHSNYALQDIIRVNDIWCEAKVGWQHIGGQEE